MLSKKCQTQRYTLWSHFLDILENCRDRKLIISYQGWMWEGELTIKTLVTFGGWYNFHISIEVLIVLSKPIFVCIHLWKKNTHRTIHLKDEFYCSQIISVFLKGERLFINLMLIYFITNIHWFRFCPSNTEGMPFSTWQPSVYLKTAPLVLT